MTGRQYSQVVPFASGRLPQDLADAGASARRSCPTRQCIIGGHEDRHLQRQRHQRAPAAPARMARARAARRRLPAGAQDARRDRSRRAHLREAGYGAVWHGQKRLERRRHPRAGRRRRSKRGAGCRATPTTPTAATSRPTSDGVVVGCLYLPNGNPQPGPKFDYKLAWFERLIAHAAEPGRRAGSRSSSRATTTSSPTDVGHLQPELWRQGRAAAAARRREATGGCSTRAGPTRCATCIPSEPIYTFWDYFRKHCERDAGLRIDHLLLNPALRRACEGRRRPLRARPREAERPRADRGSRWGRRA